MTETQDTEGQMSMGHMVRLHIAIASLNNLPIDSYIASATKLQLMPMMPWNVGQRLMLAGAKYLTDNLQVIYTALTLKAGLSKLTVA